LIYNAQLPAAVTLLSYLAQKNSASRCLSMLLTMPVWASPSPVVQGWASWGAQYVVVSYFVSHPAVTSPVLPCSQRESPCLVVAEDTRLYSTQRHVSHGDLPKRPEEARRGISVIVRTVNLKHAVGQSRYKSSKSAWWMSLRVRVVDDTCTMGRRCPQPRGVHPNAHAASALCTCLHSQRMQRDCCNTSGQVFEGRSTSRSKARPLEPSPLPTRLRTPIQV
jgi:hypothetical protein